MSNHQTTIERAYELARSGQCAGVSDIKKKLQSEGFSDIAGQLFGPAINGDLRKLCVAAKAET